MREGWTRTRYAGVRSLRAHLLKPGDLVWDHVQDRAFEVSTARWEDGWLKVTWADRTGESWINPAKPIHAWIPEDVLPGGSTRLAVHHRLGKVGS